MIIKYDMRYHSQSSVVAGTFVTNEHNFVKVCNFHLAIFFLLLTFFSILLYCLIKLVIPVVLLTNL